MKLRSVLISLAMTSFYATSFSQEANRCLEQVRKYEEFYNTNDSISGDKNIYFSYTVRATNWDNETTVSNVKLHKQGSKMHFFSEQANIYIDEKDVLVIMPVQKVIVVNSAVKGVTDHKLGDNFYKIRKEFMDSCLVVKCENKTKNVKVLVLKVDPKKNKLNLMIDEITYEFDTEAKRILSVKIDYKEDYQIKQLIMNYKEFTTESSYTYASVKHSVLDKKGNLLSTFKDYELVDNRDKENHTKHK